jgi:uncharacterized protein
MKRKWIRKCDVDENNLPIPTQIVSTEEFAPLDQTGEQKRVESRLIEIAGDSSKRLGISRRRFLASTGGMAAAFLALNSVFGNFFEVDESELFESSASDEKPFIFDIHTHHVAAPKIIQTPPLLVYRKVGGDWGNKDLVGKKHQWEDLYLANYIKEMFLDSDTSMAVITGLPAKTDSQNVLTIHTFSRGRGVCGSNRSIRHLWRAKILASQTAAPFGLLKRFTVIENISLA